MTKKDLKAGYTLEDERGRKWFLFDTKESGLEGFIIKNYNIIEDELINVESALNDNLTIKNKFLNPACNIVKVYDLPKWGRTLFKEQYEFIDVLWERPKTKKSITLELTDEQIEKVKKLLEE